MSPFNHGDVQVSGVQGYVAGLVATSANRLLHGGNVTLDATDPGRLRWLNARHRY